LEHPCESPHNFSAPSDAKDATRVGYGGRVKLWRDPWLLFDANGALLATLVPSGSDQPWLYARVEAEPSLEPLRPLFDEEVQLLERLDSDWEAHEIVIRKIVAAVRLAKPDGTLVPEFLLHISGDTAWWRWSDVPFD
jgi:hypothetical protein